MTHTLAAIIATAVLIIIPTAVGVTTKPEPVIREILIGSSCDAGNEIVTGNWSDPALNGCKEVRVHTVILTDV